MDNSSISIDMYERYSCVDSAKNIFVIIVCVLSAYQHVIERDLTSHQLVHVHVHPGYNEMSLRQKHWDRLMKLFQARQANSQNLKYYGQFYCPCPKIKATSRHYFKSSHNVLVYFFFHFTQNVDFVYFFFNYIYLSAWLGLSHLLLIQSHFAIWDI